MDGRPDKWPIIVTSADGDCYIHEMPIGDFIHRIYTSVITDFVLPAPITAEQCVFHPSAW
jgi:hypothetical protein